MTIDVYVGPVTRYLTGEWVTRDPEGGVRHHRLPDDAVAAPALVRDVVLSWRAALSRGLAPHHVTLDWDERDDAPYTAVALPRGCYGALLLLAAYDDHPELAAPDDRVEAWQQAAAFRAVSAPDAHTRYPALLKDVQWWLPAPFALGFEAPTPSGAQVRMASVDALFEQLRMLDERTLRCGAGTAPAMGRPPVEDALEPRARYALLLLGELAAAAVEARLPLLLDDDEAG